MKKLIIATLAIALTSLNVYAQTENPRGVYKMKTLIDKTGNEILAPFDQYKICTDSSTLTAFVYGRTFGIRANDEQTFNYTGDAPASPDTTASRIYDSDSRHFTLKWWSTHEGMYFPSNGWCTERYVADEYSENGKILFDAIMHPAKNIDKKNPLYGNWQRIGIYDEPQDVDEAMETFKKNGVPAYGRKDIMILTPGSMVYTGGQIMPSTSDGKTFFEVQMQKDETKRFTTQWLTDDYVVIKITRNQFRDYELWKRITDGTAPIQHMQ